MSIRLSVAICTYNGAKYLKDQLVSLEQQSRRPDEVIVSDDCSTDSTVDIVTAFASRAAFQVHLYVNTRNLGTTKNFEGAIRRCTGDIVALSDQDDFWLPHKLHRLEREFLARPDIGCVFSDAELTDQHLQSLGHNLWTVIRLGRSEFASFQQGNGLAVLLRRNVATGATMAFRANLREVLLPIPSGWIHDEWIATVTASVSKITAIDERLIKYRQHSSNQIGATRKTLSATIERSLSSHLQSVVARNKELLARIDARLVNCDRGSVSQRLQEKILHLQARIKLRESLGSGLSQGVQELVCGRYGKYSNGLRSFFSDVCYYHSRANP
jgi:glycosyltransferase involved in cell wall biosynthesis